MKLAPVQSLNQLRTKAKKDPRYAELVIIAALRMGGQSEVKDLFDGLGILFGLVQWNDETSVVEEINSYREDVGVPPMKIDHLKKSLLDN